MCVRCFHTLIVSSSSIFPCTSGVRGRQSEWLSGRNTTVKARAHCSALVTDLLRDLGQVTVCRATVSTSGKWGGCTKWSLRPFKYSLTLWLTGSKRTDFRDFHAPQLPNLTGLTYVSTYHSFHVIYWSTLKFPLKLIWPTREMELVPGLDPIYVGPSQLACLFQLWAGNQVGQLTFRDEVQEGFNLSSCLFLVLNCKPQRIFPLINLIIYLIR